jgi:hypothetical protein
MTSAMRSTLLFTLDQWIRRALKEECVKSRAPGSLIGCLNFFAMPDTEGQLILTHIAYIIGRRGALDGVEWLYYALEGDRLRATLVAAERLIQHDVRFLWKRSTGYINHRCL